MYLKPLCAGKSSSCGAGFGTKLSSAGLVYKHFGREIVAALMGGQASEAEVATIYLAVYKSFMEAIDAIDNGTALHPSDRTPQHLIP